MPLVGQGRILWRRVRNRWRFSGDAGLQSVLRIMRRRPFLAAFLLLAIIASGRAALVPDTANLLVLGIAVLAGLLAFAAGTDLVDGAEIGRSEADSFSRILRALSRSVSPDAIVDAIVEELGAGTGADHVAVVRRRPETGNVEVVLSPTRPGAPASRTTLPLSVLADPGDPSSRRVQAATVVRGRPMTAVLIDPDPDGDPSLAPLGLGAHVTTRPRNRTSLWPAPGAAALATTPRPWRAGHAAPAHRNTDEQVADLIAERLRETYGLRNLVAAPLRVDGRVEGAIVLSRRMGTWATSAGRILEAAAVETSAALGRVYSLRDAEARATTDALTGLPNRRYFDEYLLLLARRRRAEDRIGVLMIDIDRFKRLNDTFGHAVGDHVLREVAKAIAAAVRDGDVPSRFGGEEFAVLLRNPGDGVAFEVGERVRRAVRDLDLRSLGVPEVSVSVGVAVAERPDEPIAELIDAADQALYRAKRAGRDRVMAA